LYASNEQAVAYINTAWGKGETQISWEKLPYVDAFVTEDGENWTEHPRLFNGVRLNEGPRPTLSGRLIATGDLYPGVAAVIIFEDSDPLSKPKIVEIPLPIDKQAPQHARLVTKTMEVERRLLNEPSWYQTEDGRIWMFFRDECQSLRLYLSWSDDDGETWSEAIPTDFPNSMSRFHAGRLLDGRFYIVGNSIPELLNRKSLLLATSKDGRIFDEMFVLVDAPTQRRIQGMHKENGHHYPNVLVEEKKMLIIYSVNKEDIEIGILELNSTS
jgi:hypothetical protein